MSCFDDLRPVMSTRRLTLIDVYSSPSALAVLHQLLAERKPEVNISHRELPTWSEHCAFVASHPYEAWYLLEAEADIVGAIYLSRADEIGLFIFEAHQGRGFGRSALELLMERHPRKRYLVNINPANEHAIAFVNKLGFRHIQNTYEKR